MGSDLITDIVGCWGGIDGTFCRFKDSIGLVINLVLVRLKLTKTLNVDIWNYMHFLVPGALAYFILITSLLVLA